VTEGEAEEHADDDQDKHHGYDLHAPGGRFELSGAAFADEARQPDAKA
jgi:hypothetical protein